MFLKSEIWTWKKTETSPKNHRVVVVSGPQPREVWLLRSQICFGSNFILPSLPTTLQFRKLTAEIRCLPHPSRDHTHALKTLPFYRLCVELEFIHSRYLLTPTGTVMLLKDLTNTIASLIPLIICLFNNTMIWQLSWPAFLIINSMHAPFDDNILFN